MSLIYAYKTVFGIRILSDSKLTVDDNDKDRLKSILSKEEYENVIKWGVIKTIIYQSSITISAAGILEHFNELLTYLKSNNISDASKILESSQMIHNKHHMDTDFIITTKDDIYQIKNGKIQNVDFGWIGDVDAFSKFQEEKYNFAINENKCSFICFSPEEIEVLKEIEKIEYAFNSTIDNSSIDSVGGFFVKCALNANDSYEYLSEYCLYDGFKSNQILNINEQVTFFHDVEDGGYMCHILDSNNKFMVYFEQISMGIIYDSGYSDKNYCNLSLPFVIHCNYDEFLKKYSDIEQSIQLNS